jgi:nucleoside 2-deoxyribosyltransferase
MLVYLAAPLFSQAEREFNRRLTERLEERGLAVFLPQRDGVESGRPPYDAMSNEQVAQAIFSGDRDKVLEADIFLFVLDGRVPDEGACVELGIAYGQRHLLKHDKLIIGLHTDIRGAFLGEKLNAMVQGPFDSVVENEDELISAIEAYRQGRTSAEHLPGANSVS